MRQRARGFTLIEVLVASSIIGIVYLAAFSGWQIISGSRERQADAQARLTALDRAFLVLQQDLGQMLVRGISDELGGSEPAIETNSYDGGALTFSRAGYANIAPELLPPRSELLRVRWRLSDGKWQRVHWPQLDRMVADSERVRTLLEGVESVGWRFLDAEREWRDSWPPLDRQPDDPITLPVAIEMTLTLEGQAPIPRLFLVGN